MLRRGSMMAITMLAMCPLAALGTSAETPQNKTSDKTVIIDTFDSGFGGYFTAKAIEEAGNSLVNDRQIELRINHFGDTAMAPYGERTPEEIASLTSGHVIDALKKGADKVYIACNTASTQYTAVHDAVEKQLPGRGKDVIPIIDVSVEAVKKHLDPLLEKHSTVFFAVLSTPATFKARAYPNALAKLYGGQLQAGKPERIEQARWFQEKGKTIDSFRERDVIDLPQGKHIVLYELAPANWVDLIEHGAPNTDKEAAVQRDMALLFSIMEPQEHLEGVGEFCTHYPAFDASIQQTVKAAGKSDHAFFIKQGPLMAELFKQQMEAEFPKRATPIPPAALQKLREEERPTITVSGDNVDTTRRLATTIFSQAPAPVMYHANTYPTVPAAN